MTPQAHLGNTLYAGSCPADQRDLGSLHTGRRPRPKAPRCAADFTESWGNEEPRSNRGHNEIIDRSSNAQILSQSLGEHLLFSARHSDWKRRLLRCKLRQRASRIAEQNCLVYIVDRQCCSRFLSGPRLAGISGGRGVQRDLHTWNVTEIESGFQSEFRGVSGGLSSRRVDSSLSM